MSAPARRLLAVLIVAIVGYTMWLISDRYLAAFILLGLVSLTARILLYLAGPWLASVVLLRLLPEPYRSWLRRNRRSLVVVTAIALFFLLRVGMVVNHAWLPGRYHPVSLAADGLILLMAVFLAWVLFRLRRAGVFLFPAAALAVVWLSSGIEGRPPSNPQNAGRTGRGQARDVLALTTLPYVTHVPGQEKPAATGVVYYDVERSSGGLNLCTAVESPRAFLLDMDGNVVHEWTTDLDPDYVWEFVTLCRNGDLVVSIQNRKLVKLDWDSNVKWVKKLRCHHDLDVAENGDITALTRRYRMVSVHGIPVPARDDYAVTLSEDGEFKSEFSIGEALASFIPLSRAIRICQWQLTNFKFSIEHRVRNQYMFDKGFVDLLHTNTARIVGRDVSDVLRRGYVITCSPVIDVIAVINPETGEAVWEWGKNEL